MLGVIVVVSFLKVSGKPILGYGWISCALIYLLRWRREQKKSKKEKIDCRPLPPLSFPPLAPLPASDCCHEESLGSRLHGFDGLVLLVVL